MHEYETFLIIQSDRREAAKRMRMLKFAQEAQEGKRALKNKEAKPRRLRFTLNFRRWLPRGNFGGSEPCPDTPVSAH
jgi:hypothetical protein